jgi:hypothetical protein
MFFSTCDPNVKEQNHASVSDLIQYLSGYSALLYVHRYYVSSPRIQPLVVRKFNLIDGVVERSR